MAAQQALHAERWPKYAAIRARIALHTGAAELRNGDYFGPPLNHVARLLAGQPVSGHRQNFFERHPSASENLWPHPAKREGRAARLHSAHRGFDFRSLVLFDLD